jgi:hypothetical protein
LHALVYQSVSVIYANYLAYGWNGQTAAMNRLRNLLLVFDTI